MPGVDLDACVALPLRYRILYDSRPNEYLNQGEWAASGFYAPEPRESEGLVLRPDPFTGAGEGSLKSSLKTLAMLKGDPQFGKEADFLTKTTVLGVFDFRHS
ncbi:MAG: hypothetical protein WCL44_03790 [bacterium]